MLGFLPTIGLVIGLIWAAIYVGLVYLGFPFLVVSFILAFLPFALCGFMHMDGFMDCSDAIMSRRPLEDRQRILKDTHTGAFAVISAIFMILGYFAFVSTAASMGMDFVNIVICLAVQSQALRFCSANLWAQVSMWLFLMELLLRLPRLKKLRNPRKSLLQQQRSRAWFCF